MNRHRSKLTKQEYDAFAKDIMEYHGIGGVKEVDVMKQGIDEMQREYATKWWIFINGLLSKSKLLSNFYMNNWFKCIDECSIKFNEYTLNLNICIIDFQATVKLSPSLTKLYWDYNDYAIRYNETIDEYVFENDINDADAIECLNNINEFKYSIRLNELLVRQFDQ